MNLLFANLVSSRNILLNGRFNANVDASMKEILLTLDSVPTPVFRQIVKYCIFEAELEIRKLNYRNAGRILDLIHNLPFEESKVASWDVDYFLSMELPNFLEYFKEIPPARNIALFVCRELSTLYLSEHPTFSTGG